ERGVPHATHRPRRPNPHGPRSRTRRRGVRRPPHPKSRDRGCRPAAEHRRRAGAAAAGVPDRRRGAHPCRDRPRRRDARRPRDVDRDPGRRGARADGVRGRGARVAVHGSRDPRRRAGELRLRAAGVHHDQLRALPRRRGAQRRGARRGVRRERHAPGAGAHGRHGRQERQEDHLLHAPPVGLHRCVL
ncbi:MAG: hypothetical protein AVDCRST_MAG11-1248, partial [uncultured Gemmatimonadaceae bacterium]